MGVKPKYTGPKRPEIQTLLENYRNLYPALDNERFERLTLGVLSNDQLTQPVVLSPRGDMLDGYHRCLILLTDGRKQLTENEYTIDYTAVDELSRWKAHVHYQEDRRPSASADQAAMARTVMRRFGWSAGKFAEEFGFSSGTVHKWLQRNPDPAFDAEMAERGREGVSGKTYTEPPKKRGKTEDSPGTAVRKVTNKYLAELTDPVLAQWICDHVDGGDREEVSVNWERIASASAAISGAVAPVAPVSDAPFEPQSPAAATTEPVMPTKKALILERRAIVKQQKDLKAEHYWWTRELLKATEFTWADVRKIEENNDRIIEMDKRISVIGDLLEMPSKLLKEVK